MLRALFCLLVLSGVVPGTDAADRPDIVVILADDLGYGDVGVHGCADIATPHIDSLAADGVRFSNGYSSHPFCSPMRAGLLACRYQHRFGYVTNVAFDPHNTRMGLPTSETTIAQRLADAGYRTGMVGKWHLGAASPFHPKNRGFDYFYGFLGGGHDYFRVDTTVQLHENYRAAIDNNGQPAGLDGYLTQVLTDQAIDFIKDSGNEPYFLLVAYNAPHTPLQAPDKKIAEHASIANRKRRIYAAMVSAMDDQIGRLLAEIDGSDRRDRTLVAFLSDNGGPEQANASDNGILRGQKGDVFEGGVRVPFLMRMPGTLPAGLVYDQPVISFDISRTALSLADATIDRELEGVDLIPYVTGVKSGSPHPLLCWRMQGDTQWAIRRGNQKLVVIDGQRSLFDLSDDPGEQHDLSLTHEQQVTSLEAAFAEWNRHNQPGRFPSYRTYHEQLRSFHQNVEEQSRNDDRR